MKKNQPVSLEQIGRQLKDKRGKRYWRTLEELAESEAFRELVENEFPESPFDWKNAFSRRKFLQLMGASMAFAGLTACTRQPLERIIPYVKPPEEIIPGKPLYFATANTMRGYAVGVLVESHMGRPTKIEGNPDHPASLGASDIFAQASILDLYDPDRSRVVKYLGRIGAWEDFLSAMRTELEAQKLNDGAGVRILTETVTSPTLHRQLQAFLSAFPLAKWHQYEPAHTDNTKAGAQLAFGQFVDTRYDFENADVILSLDADFLVNHPASLPYARQFSARRRPEAAGHMNRLYVAESTPTLTGSMADHRWPLRASELPALAFKVADALGAVAAQNLSLEAPLDALDFDDNRVRAIAEDLQRHAGRCLVVAGEAQPPEVHLLAHAMNFALGNVGKTVFYTDPVEANPVLHGNSLRELVEEMQAGSVDLLVMLGGNPLFNAPADLNFADAFSKVRMRVHLSLHEDETSNFSHWHIPQAHYLESWSDARAFDGTVSIIQPLILPLYGGKSMHELMAVLLEDAGKSDYDIVKETWRGKVKDGEFEKFWRKTLHDGVMAGTALPQKKMRLRPQKRKLNLTTASGSSAGDLEVAFRPDPTIWDGRYANNGWLQELPKPLTKLTWDNAVMLSPQTAEKLQVENEDLVELRYGGRTVRGAVWILPGQPDGTVTVHFGHGRERVGQVGQRTGFNAYALRRVDAPWFDRGLQVHKTGEKSRLATTQHHHNMENRHLVRSGTLAEFLAHPEFVREMGEDPPPEMTLYPRFEYKGYAWGMAVDLNACIGCNACVVACQSENNIPVVGKDQVARGREMHWIRIDRYYEGELESPETLHQPVMCMHCEDAPCEVVCPVGATTHSPEGLNEMVYNRCVGTRYCSNNCPYKVRRFNFYHYADYETPSLKLMRNPDVTVRTRGVMEKCTYCVQRINQARITAEKEDRSLRDGEIVTACQQVCPTDAIVFGDINDPQSRVARLKAEERNYGILTELGTRPRTSYLARIRNPNPDIEKA